MRPFGALSAAHGVGKFPAGLFVLALVALNTPGCRAPAKQSLVDTERRRFLAECPRDGDCRLSLDPTAPLSAAASPKPSFSLLKTGRVVGICETTTAGASPNVANCRPLVCQADADCPPAQGLIHGVCINQLCTEPSHAVIVDDAVQLCLAGTGTGPRSPLQIERLALGLNCGSPCQIPKPCRQL